MNSPRLKKYDEFDATIGLELESWAERQQPPAGGREALLQAAGKRKQRAVLRAPRALRKLKHWLISPQSSNHPGLPYNELSQWLYAQAMWHSLDNDRRAVRFVC